MGKALGGEKKTRGIEEKSGGGWKENEGGRWRKERGGRKGVKGGNAKLSNIKPLLKGCKASVVTNRKLVYFSPHLSGNCPG